KEYLKYGYYPYYFEMPSKELYYITLEQNVHTTIEADLCAIYPHLSGSSVAKIKQLLIFISKEVPFTPNWSKIRESLDIGDDRTLKTYFRYLEDAYLIRSIQKEKNKLKDINSLEKVYLDNPNQMQALSFENVNLGTQREIFFINMLSLKHEVNLAPQ